MSVCCFLCENEINKAVSAIERGKPSPSLTTQNAQSRLTDDAAAGVSVMWSSAPSEGSEEKIAVSNGPETNQWSNCRAKDVSRLSEIRLLGKEG